MVDGPFGSFLGGINAGLQQQSARQQYRRGELDMERARAQMEAERAAAQAAAQAAEMERQRQARAAGVIGNRLGLPGRIQGGALQGMGVPGPMAGQQAPAMTTVQQPVSVGGGTPQAMQQPAQPMQQQVDPATGRAVDVFTVTGQGMQRPQPWEGLREATPREIAEAQLMAAYQAGDWQHVNELFPVVQGFMTADEQRGRQLIGAAATQILQLPPEQRQAAVRQALAQFGIDPATTGIDDITDPAELERALQFEAFRGNPEAAMEEQIRVQGTRQEFRRPEVLDLGGTRSVVSMSGTNPGQQIQSYNVTADPNAQLQAQTAAADRATRVRIAGIQAGSAQRIAAINADSRLTIQQRQEAIQRERMATDREIAVLTGRTIGNDETLGSYVEPEF